MTGFVGDIEKLTEKNKNFRKVLYTGKYAQLVVMCLEPREEIGNEVHDTVDQFFRIEEGKAKFVFSGNEEHLVKAGDAVIVPAGTFHNVINASSKERLQAIHPLLTTQPSGWHSPQDQGGSRSS